MKKTTILATTIISGLLTFATVAQADQKGGEGWKAKHGEMSAERMQKRMDRMATKLGLSDEQKTQLQALKLNSRNEIKPLRNEQRALRKEIRELDPKASDYQEKVADAANRQAELTRQMIIAKGNNRQQMASILTPEQLAKMQEHRGKRKGGHGKRKHKRHHGKHQK